MDQRTDRHAELSPAPRILSGDVLSSSEQTGAMIHLSGPELAHLLERAAHPIVLRGPEYSPAPYATPAGSGAGAGHPGINLTIPSADAYGYVILPANLAPLPEVTTPREWAPLTAIASIGAFLSGPIVGILVGSDTGAALLCLVGFVGGIASFIRLLRTD